MDSSDTFDFYDGSAIERAKELLQEIKTSDSPIQTRSIAKKALEISEQCYEAWLLLAANYSHAPQKKETLLKAVTVASAHEDAEHHALLVSKLSSLYYKTNELDAVIELLSSMDNKLTESYHYLCLSHLHKGNYNEATMLCSEEIYADTLSARVAHAYLHFKESMPQWKAEQMEELHHQLLGKTLWQWIHPQCNSLKRSFRSINHQNPFLAAFLLNPRCHEIELPAHCEPRHASEALQVAQDFFSLWEHEGILLNLLEEFPWENPTKHQIADEDKPLLRQTISLLEEHREALRAEAEQDYLSEDVFY